MSISEFFKGRTFKILIVALVILIVALILNPIVVIGPTDRGVYVKLGEVKNEVLAPGIHIKTPLIEEIKTFSVIPVEIDTVIAVGQDGALSKDQQNIGVATAMYWRYKEDKIVEAAKQYNSAIVESILKSSLPTSIKAIVGQYSVVDIVPNQNKIMAEATVELRSLIANLPVEVTQVNLKNWDWDDSYEQQVKMTNELRQQVESEKQKLDQVSYSSQAQVKEAEGKKAAIIAEAEGRKEAARLDADAKALEGEGIKRYNESIRATQDIEIKLRELAIKQTEMDKWNGQKVSDTQVVVPGFGTIQASK